jgi:hypothetical protein
LRRFLRARSSMMSAPMQIAEQGGGAPPLVEQLPPAELALPAGGATHLPLGSHTFGGAQSLTDEHVDVHAPPAQR